MSKSQPAPSLIQVPERFSIVEAGVYRSASPTAAQVPFLATLQLRTIISLTPEFPVRQLVQYTRNAGVEFHHLGTTMWRPLTDWKPIRDEVVKKTLEMILDKRNHPMLLVDPLGIHQTGCVVGSLRIMQGWNFASALVEYRAHSGGTKHRYTDEQYIELFDPDLINIPPSAHLPEWYQPLDDEDDTEIIDWDEDEADDGDRAGPHPAGEKANQRAAIESSSENEQVEQATTDPTPNEPGVG